jgi:hypothetical protein
MAVICFPAVFFGFAVTVDLSALCPAKGQTVFVVLFDRLNRAFVQLRCPYGAAVLCVQFVYRQSVSLYFCVLQVTHTHTHR